MTDRRPVRRSAARGITRPWATMGAMALLAPMLTTVAESASELPDDGLTWAYEVKWDGVRVLAHVNTAPKPRIRIVSRAGNEATAAYPEFAALSGALAAGHTDAVLDGEVVVLREGRPSFSALAERMHVREARRAAALAAKAPATFIAFDLLRLDGEDLTSQPWSRRRELLAGALTSSSPTWQLSPVYDDRDALVAATVEQELEGVVAKRRSSRYHCGRRTDDWIKLAHKRFQSAVVGGWRWETGSRDRLGALLIGVPDGDGGLAFAGRVGSGITAPVARHLRELLEAAPAQASPFTTEVPAVDARGTMWTVPAVVVEVRYLGRGEAGRLRQPVFRGVRSDLSPDDVRWEA
ncbi:MAG: non-homologous end-joining DNA ligase [Kineosporiaceae bacterium]